MKEKFEGTRFQPKTLHLIAQAEAIINPMRAAGYTLTIRQLFYQFVQRGLLENTPQNYERLGKVMHKARLAGLIDWDAIEDRTRFIRSRNIYTDQSDFIARLVEYEFAMYVWEDQPAHCEVWIEKDALIGVIERVCFEYRVSYLACRGYTSTSELYEAGKRFKRYLKQGKRCIIFHLGDHDPSGIHMTTANNEAVSMFARTLDIEVIRLGLNLDQVQEYDPPPNTAKETDSRTPQYIEEFGFTDCWELDALAPQVIEDLIRNAIEGIIDREKFDAALAHEETYRAPLRRAGEEWEGVERYLTYRDTQVVVADGPTGDDVTVSADDVLDIAETEPTQRR